ncbi:MAG: hypothetical protein WC683_12340 [bacterium]
MIKQAPIFPSVFISSGINPVPQIFTPQAGIGAAPIASPTDAFAIGPPAGSSAATGINCSTQSQQLRRLNEEFAGARDAREKNDVSKACDHYERTLVSLELPFDGPHASPLPVYMEINGGIDLYKEALFETSVLSTPEKAPQVLRRLHRFIEKTYPGIKPSRIDTARAKTLEAYALMQHTGSTFARRGAMFDRGLYMLGDVIKRLEHEPDLAGKEKALKAFELVNNFKTVAQFRSALVKLKKALEAIDIDKLSKNGKTQQDDALQTTEQMPEAGQKARISWIWGRRKSSQDLNGNENTYTAAFLRAFTLINLGMLCAAPRLNLMQKALSILKEAAELVDPEASALEADTHFAIGLLTAEIISRKLTLAHGRRDVPAQKRLAHELNEVFESISADHSRDDAKNVGPTYAGTLPSSYKNDLIASYQADAAILMARLGLWNDALFWARAVTQGQFEFTAAAARLLKDPAFRPFVMNHRILSGEDIGSKAKRGSWHKRLKVAIRQSHSTSVMESLGYSAAGMLPGLAAYLMYDVKTAGVCMAGVALANIFNRLKNGWRTEEAQYAAITGKYDSSSLENAKALGRLGIHTAFDALPWIFPSSFLDFEKTGLDVVYNTVASSLEMAGDKIGNVSGVLFDPNTYAPVISALSSVSAPSSNEIAQIIRDSIVNTSAAIFASNLIWPETRKLMMSNWGYFFLPPLLLFGYDLGQMPDFGGLKFIYHAYTYGAAALFALQMKPPTTIEQKEHMNAMAKWFLPGAFMLSSDIGRWMAHGPDDPSYAERMVRAAVLTTEAYLMMHVLGNVKFKWNHSKGIPKNLWTLAKNTVNANPALPLAIVTINAFTAPLGGFIQRDKHLDNIVLIALQGVATTACMLPITLGISGVLKRSIPIKTRAEEGLEDSRAAGDNPLKQRYHWLTGGLSAFNTTYAQNRVLRSGSWDIIPAALRTFAGWDTFGGQLLMSGTNIVHGNSVSSRMWPELSGSTWSRQSVISEFQNAFEALDDISQRRVTGAIDGESAHAETRVIFARLRTFFQKAAQVMHPAHLFMAHEALPDRLIPFFSFMMAAKPPTFPQLPDKHFLADFYLMLHGGHSDERLSIEQFRTLLAYVKADAADPSAHDTVRPLVQLLALARENMDPNYKKLIEDFFDKNPEIPIMVDVDLEEHAPLMEKYRRVARRKVRKIVKMPFKDYEQRINGNRRQDRAHIKLDGLFLKP